MSEFYGYFILLLLVVDWYHFAAKISDIRASDEINFIFRDLEAKSEEMISDEI